MQHVLVLGAGFVAGSLIDKLHSSGIQITLASQFLSEAEALARQRSNIQCLEIDVADTVSTTRLVAGHDLVISLLPAMFHVTIANICIDQHTHMITASYASPEMLALDKSAKKAGIIILNEIGLDPGIDHLTAMKVIDEVRAEGGKVDSFVSWCGGLPAPEANDNPFGYKFAWSPKAALLALLNDARFQDDGEEKFISEGELLIDPMKVNISGIEFEAYPNRDSLVYTEIYGLQDAKKMLRCTLRYPGFCKLLHACKNLGLLDASIDHDLVDRNFNWLEWISKKNNLDVAQLPACLGLDESTHQALDWLGIFDPDAMPQAGTAIDSFCELLNKKLAYTKGERDLIVLHHEFQIINSKGITSKSSSTMLVYGERDGYSAMCKTVGLPVALAAELILDGSLDISGVIRPVIPSIYNPLLERLEVEGIFCEHKLH